MLVDTEPKVVHLASKLSNPHALNSLSSEKKKKVRDASGGSSGTSVETDGHRQQSRKQQHCRYVPRTAIHRVRPSSIYRSENVHFEQFGRGNNWALGYNGREGKEGREGSITFRALESLRREAERCDVFDSVVLTHSIAGGTGSGLGSRILEEISHAYPTQYLVSAAVTPFTTGTFNVT